MGNFLLKPKCVKCVVQCSDKKQPMEEGILYHERERTNIEPSLVHYVHIQGPREVLLLGNIGMSLMCHIHGDD